MAPTPAITSASSDQARVCWLPAALKFEIPSGFLWVIHLCWATVWSWVASLQ